MAAGRRFAVGGGRRAVLAGLLLATVALMLLRLGFRSIGVWLAAGGAASVRADVIVALGGDDGHWIRKVAEVFRAGYANNVLIAGPEGSPELERAYYLNWRPIGFWSIRRRRIRFRKRGRRWYCCKAAVGEWPWWSAIRRTCVVLTGCGERCFQYLACRMCCSPASQRGGLQSTGGRARGQRSSC